MVGVDTDGSMDGKLISWAKAVKRRKRLRHPVLWLFTDPRGPDPLQFARLAPRGLCGIVLRHDADPARAQLAQAIAEVCRERGLALTIAGDWRLARAAGAGLHLRDGRKPPHAPRGWRLLTSSAHGAASLRRARAAGALVFLSPAFPTASHPGSPALGPLRWSRLAGGGAAMADECVGAPGVGAQGLTAPGVAALGGITGRTIRLLPRAVAAGAIGALATR